MAFKFHIVRQLHRYNNVLRQSVSIPRSANSEARDVLIGTFRSQMQFGACLDHRFYYIPMEYIPEEQMPIRYVAMLQTPRIFPETPGIRYYGEVRQMDVVRRKHISQVPMRTGTNPDAPYFRFTVWNWIPLERTILPRESGFVRDFTCFYQLAHAEYVSELLLTREEFCLYTLVKHRAREAALSGAGCADDLTAGDCTFRFRDGTIFLLQKGTVVCKSANDAFFKEPTTVFRRLMQSADSPEGGTGV